MPLFEVRQRLRERAREALDLASHRWGKPSFASQCNEVVELDPARSAESERIIGNEANAFLSVSEGATSDAVRTEGHVRLVHDEPMRQPAMFAFLS